MGETTTAADEPQGVTGAPKTAEQSELSILKEKRTNLQEMLSVVRKELAEESATHLVLDLRREVKQIEDAIRKLNVLEFELNKRIKRPVAARECRCPTCERFVPSGTVLSAALREALNK